ncbi:MAG: DNA primase [Candidatus Magasanikbacteria bacterium CG10_big_fil_rev_8_21_14_0_10_47_10]|uniref:DNA primase n=1 Tax=Candidatus Magasanikbacteria bacterium CG10_big_fil_rev_8_21_14_0_10_47_10 TaxID=1974652 RepID=A0A2H0TRT9_9BACT|nr:MAG: DNA primase [Candidatus Magasanikbacteria bacterium CG10_big_fil_rev_8_21_14_0_10_47_10]
MLCLTLCSAAASLYSNLAIREYNLPWMSDTQLIKDKIDIVDFIGEYVQLKPAGINHKGLCPFHNEKSPSFMASRERNSWHCFGCSKGGDIFTFVQEIEGMDFIEALKLLAGRAGVELSTKQSELESSEKNRLKDIMTDAARFYHNVLTKIDSAKSAREYLRQRGLLPATVETWQIGYIPDQWDLLTQYLLKKGFGIDDLVASGMTIKRERANAQSGKGFYDRFRGRIMFPIRDVHGNVVGFTGRVLVETEKSGGKYVNTPQTPLYDKSSVVFGLDKAKHEIRKKDVVVMVEGQMDVIGVWQSGMPNVVATSGTALTEQQVALLKRYAQNISIAFDADDAGYKAAKRGIDLARQAGVNVRIIRVPDGLDPDDFVKKDPEGWRGAVADAVDVMQWYVDRAFAGQDLKNPKHKQVIANELLPEIARIPFAVEKDHWLQAIAAKLGVDPGILRQDMPDVRESAETVQSRGQAPSSPPEEKKQKGGQRDTLEQHALSLLLTRGIVDGDAFLRLDPVFATSAYRPLYELLKKGYTEGNSIDIESIISQLSDSNLHQTLNSLLLKGDEVFSLIDNSVIILEFRQLAQQIVVGWKKEIRQQLQLEIAQAEQSGDDKKVAELLQQVSSL